MVTVICDIREQEDYTLENIMTKQSLGFIEKLYNATCLNTDMTVNLVLSHDMFTWRVQNLQEEETNESEDLDEKLDEESEEEDEGSDGYFSNKIRLDEEFYFVSFLSFVSFLCFVMYVSNNKILYFSN
ncbi:hypothetical protein Hanom_Chr17g01573041 [Helianthus anomalus]